jgi:glutaredoxin-related protein
MPIYTCKKCKKTFKQKGHYSNHLKRLRPCISIDLDTKTKFACKYCDKEYPYKYNLNRHLKVCKEKENLYDVINVLKDEVANLRDQLKTTINNTMNKTVNNNNTYNDNKQINYNISLQLNEFGKEDLSYIKGDELDQLLALPGSAVQQLVKLIHCNKDHPENCNIYKSNNKRKEIRTYTDEGWETHDQDKVLEKLVDKTFGILEDHYNSKDTTTFREDRFKNLQDEYDENNLRRLHNPLTFIVYNNKNLKKMFTTLKTKKQLK